MNRDGVSGIVEELELEAERLAEAAAVLRARYLGHEAVDPVVEEATPCVYAGALPDGDELPDPAPVPPSHPRTRNWPIPPLRERIVAALHGVPSASWDEIIDLCQPTTPDSLKVCLRECVAAGTVERVGRGRYALPTQVV